MNRRRKTYTISEAASRLHITPEAILKAIKTGRLKAKLKTALIPKRIWSIAAESLEAYHVSFSHQQRGLKNP
jgi:hypothetical protein